MKFQLAIFDLDGTLVDSVADLAEAVNHTLNQMGYPVHPVDAFYHFVGNGVKKLCERALPADAGEGEAERLLTGFSAYYAAHCMDHTRPYPGIAEAVDRMKGAGMQLAVASNKPQLFTERIVTHFFGKETFDCILGSNDIRPRKPAPDIVTDILQSLSVPRQQAVLVGDSEVDIQTAANAGIASIGCIWGFRSREELLAAGASCLAWEASALPDMVLVANE